MIFLKLINLSKNVFILFTIIYISSNCTFEKYFVILIIIFTIVCRNYLQMYG